MTSLKVTCTETLRRPDELVTRSTVAVTSEAAAPLVSRPSPILIARSNTAWSRAESVGTDRSSHTAGGPRSRRRADEAHTPTGRPGRFRSEVRGGAQHRDAEREGEQHRDVEAAGADGERADRPHRQQGPHQREDQQQCR